MLIFNMDDARTQLRRAINESDFESAKNYARRARSALDDASMGAMDCGCMSLQFDLACFKSVVPVLLRSHLFND